VTRIGNNRACKTTP
jgi:hypothetical protein